MLDRVALLLKLLVESQEGAGHQRYTGRYNEYTSIALGFLQQRVLLPLHFIVFMRLELIWEVTDPDHDEEFAH